MTEVSDIELTPEQETLREEVKTKIAEAAGACACSHAKFTPDRIALSVARDRVSQETANEITSRFAACTGMSNGRCNYPPPTQT